MNYPRGTLFALLIGAPTLLAGCGTTHIVDTSPALGSPRIVASDVKVKVTPYADATKPEGGRVDEQQILGQVVMGRGDYSLLMAEIAGLSESIKKLKADNRILGAYAEQCARAAR